MHRPQRPSLLRHCLRLQLSLSPSSSSLSSSLPPPFSVSLILLFIKLGSLALLCEMPLGGL